MILMTELIHVSKSLNVLAKNTLKVTLLTHGSPPWNKGSNDLGRPRTKISIPPLQIYQPSNDRSRLFDLIEGGEGKQSNEKELKQDTGKNASIASNYGSKWL
ncbi:hypothetical protein Tco_0755042 [Tanacetum coccineum]